MVICGTPPRRSGHVTGSDCTDSQADNAGSIPVTTPREKPRSVRQSRAWASSVHAVPGVRANWPAISLLETGAPLGPRCHRRPDRNRAGRASRSHPYPLIGACEEDGASGNRPGSAAGQVLMWGCAERTATGAGDLRKRTGRLQTEDTA